MSRYRERGAVTVKELMVSNGWTRAQCMRTPQNTLDTRTVSSAPPVTNYSYDDRETMSDVVGSPGLYNPVTHIRRRSFPLPGVQLARFASAVPNIYTLAPGVWYTFMHDCGFSKAQSLSFQGLRNPYGTLTTPNFPGIDWASLVNTVGQQLDGHMLTGQNLLVDFVQIAQTIAMVRNPFQLLRNMRLPRKTREMPLSKLRAALRRSSSSYLEYKFGWENLYRSVLAIANVWKEVRTHMEYLRKTADQFVPLSASSVQTMLCPDLFRSVGDDLSGTLLPSIREVKQTARFSLNVRRDQSAIQLNRLDLVVDRLGLTDLGEALWDAVPYSFVVDWFTHVNRVVKQAPIVWTGRELRRMGYSITVEWFGDLTLRSRAWNSFGGWGPFSERYYGPHSVQKSYVRYEGFPPNTSSVGLFGNLNKTQIAEGLALIVQRI